MTSGRTPSVGVRSASEYASAMDAVTREHARALTVRAEKVKEAIEAVRAARTDETACVDGGEAIGRARARRELAELAEYHALRDYFTAGETLREAIERS